ncbi:GDP-mannose 4,6-dehydratase [Candidatus Woesearchaeota archaeon]|nr:GDP-mannose 4,6-dehydratase [Candidatus Woesearchaeota archaeon]
MRIFVTGGAGFIGSHMAHTMLKQGHSITVFDNLQCGDTSRIDDIMHNPKFKFVKGDLLNKQELNKAIKGHDFVFHFAANPDIAKAMEEPDIDLRLTVIATFNLLDAMRLNNVRKIAYPSGSGVYGDVGSMPTAEDFGPLLPISMYGASKLGAEGLITAFCHMYDMQSWIYRFANVIGSRQTHGVILDFILKLKKNPKELLILGDGSQSKSYVHVSEIIGAMLYCIENSKEKVNLYNVSCDDFVSVNEIAEMVREEMRLPNAKFKYTGGKRGWKGDVPVVRIDATKLKKLGYDIKLSSKEAVRRTIKELLEELK